ncbi:hypothetical protein B0O99DRAFT_610882 [Bisporella sp. PMI_857]|nr:hypothetical protein B0O99DRAFT_612325 [Bisporella sp. PMI_857]KAH8600527.1 hypothetical protein B0O99DRAFT_610882 [Bisporella sp. PMI_857]
MADSSEPKAAPGDLVRRGIKNPNVPGTLTFVALRALDPFIQYGIIAGGIGHPALTKLGLRAIPPGAAFTTGISWLDRLRLPPAHLILLGMSLGSFLKQTYWLVRLSAEDFPPSSAVKVSLFNILTNGVNSFLFLNAATSVLSGDAAKYKILAGSLLYVTGILLETGAEWQRKRFKDKPENKGKVMKSGLWSLARHVNYGGYSLWRAGYAIAATGFIGGIITASFFFYNFTNRAIPALDEYCGKRYGQQWVQFKKEVKSVILPGIY